MTTEDGTPESGAGTDRAAKARAARSRLALERRADYLRERGWTCTPPRTEDDAECTCRGEVACPPSCAVCAARPVSFSCYREEHPTRLTRGPALGPGELNPAPTLRGLVTAHDYLMPHDLRYGDNDPRHCPPNCPASPALLEQESGS